MKLGPIFSLLLVILSHFTLHAQAQVKFCPKEMMLKGTCGGTRGGYDCALEFLAKYGARAMPMHCSCKDVAHQRQCKCDIVCQ